MSNVTNNIINHSIKMHNWMHFQSTDKILHKVNNTVR